MQEFFDIDIDTGIQSEDKTLPLPFWWSKFAQNP
jgi:hypothetical protein